MLGRNKTLSNLHRAGVPLIQWKKNQNSFTKQSLEYKSHCTENVCCAEQREMSSKGLQSLRRSDPRKWKPAVNNVKSGKPWFRKAPVGVNKLNTLMKTMAQKAGLGPSYDSNFVVNKDVPPTDIMWLSVTVRIQNYSTVSQKQQLNMSHTLTGLNPEEIVLQPGCSILDKRKHESDELTYPTFRPTFSQQSKKIAQQPLSLFSGALIIERPIVNKHFKSISHCERKTLAKLIKESNLLIRILTSVWRLLTIWSKHAGSDILGLGFSLMYFELP